MGDYCFNFLNFDIYPAQCLTAWNIITEPRNSKHVPSLLPVLPSTLWKIELKDQSTYRAQIWPGIYFGRVHSHFQITRVKICQYKILFIPLAFGGLEEGSLRYNQWFFSYLWTVPVFSFPLTFSNQSCAIKEERF